MSKQQQQKQKKKKWHPDWTEDEKAAMLARCNRFGGFTIHCSRAVMEELDRHVHQDKDPIYHADLWDRAIFGKATKADYKRFYKKRKAFGRRIDPATAEVDWEYGQEMDPYRVLPFIPDKYPQIGRNYFARDPKEKEWVAFENLPAKTCRVLLDKYRHRLCSFVIGEGGARWNKDHLTAG
jgi:hypothetical protein